VHTKPKVIEGSIVDVFAKLSTVSGGEALTAVLKRIQDDVVDSRVRVAPNLRRALIELPSGKRATVRVSTGRLIGSAALRFRFKRPADLQQYSYLFFGGVTANGNALVRKLSPTDVGRLKTITLTFEQ
jgi:hypothetical protein